VSWRRRLLKDARTVAVGGLPSRLSDRSVRLPISPVRNPIQAEQADLSYAKSLLIEGEMFSQRGKSGPTEG